jgi:hypothetical protein
MASQQTRHDFVELIELDRSLAFALHDQCYDCNNRDNEQNWPPYTAISIHRAHTPTAATHHASGLRPSNAGGQEGPRTRSQCNQCLHQISQVKSRFNKLTISSNGTSISLR